MPEIIKNKYTKVYKISSAINAGESYVIPIPTADIDEHKFFNDLTVSNLDSVDIEVTPDNDSNRVFPVASRSEKSFSFVNDNTKFSSLKVTNLSSSAATTANKIILYVMKKRKEVVGQGE